jgi:hypothetical protein
MKIIINTIISLAIIMLVNCALLFPKHTCEDYSYSCQQAKEKSNECNGYIGQKQTDCYEELRTLQENCSKDCSNKSTDINTDNKPTNTNDKLPRY